MTDKERVEEALQKLKDAKRLMTGLEDDTLNNQAYMTILYAINPAIETVRDFAWVKFGSWSE